jgi:hypothetical protein
MTWSPGFRRAMQMAKMASAPPDVTRMSSLVRPSYSWRRACTQLGRAGVVSVAQVDGVEIEAEILELQELDGALTRRRSGT